MEDDITEITSAEIEMALRNTKNGKATGTGPNKFPVEVWKGLGRTGCEFSEGSIEQDH